LYETANKTNFATLLVPNTKLQILAVFYVAGAWDRDRAGNNHSNLLQTIL
jgi:hypothetical protein